MTNIGNLNQDAKGVAEPTFDQAINALVETFKLEEIIHTLDMSLYAAFLWSSFKEDREREKIVYAILELKRVLPLLFNGNKKNLHYRNFIPYDVVSENGIDTCLNPLRLLFSAYIVSEFTDGFDSKQRKYIHDQYQALELFIRAAHTTGKTELNKKSKKIA